MDSLFSLLMVGSEAQWYLPYTLVVITQYDLVIFLPMFPALAPGNSVRWLGLLCLFFQFYWSIIDIHTALCKFKMCSIMIWCTYIRYEDDTTLTAESKEKPKSLLMRVKEESEKASLKLSIQKTKNLTSGPIISWQIDGETMETVTDFIFLGSKITADGDCSHEIKRHLLLGRKAIANLDSILKSRDITFQLRSI